MMNRAGALATSREVANRSKIDDGSERGAGRAIALNGVLAFAGDESEDVT
jgi:hypothetical protein